MHCTVSRFTLPLHTLPGSVVPTKTRMPRLEFHARNLLQYAVVYDLTTHFEAFLDSITAREFFPGGFFYSLRKRGEAFEEGVFRPLVAQRAEDQAQERLRKHGVVVRGVELAAYEQQREGARRRRRRALFHAPGPGQGAAADIIPVVHRAHEAVEGRRPVAGREEAAVEHEEAQEDVHPRVRAREAAGAGEGRLEVAVIEQQRRGGEIPRAPEGVARELFKAGAALRVGQAPPQALKCPGPEPGGLGALAAAVRVLGQGVERKARIERAGLAAGVRRGVVPAQGLIPLLAALLEAEAAEPYHGVDVARCGARLKFLPRQLCHWNPPISLMSVLRPAAEVGIVQRCVYYGGDELQAYRAHARVPYPAAGHHERGDKPCRGRDEDNGEIEPQPAPPAELKRHAGPEGQDGADKIGRHEQRLRQQQHGRPEIELAPNRDDGGEAHD